MGNFRIVFSLSLLTLIPLHAMEKNNNTSLQKGKPLGDSGEYYHIGTKERQKTLEEIEKEKLQAEHRIKKERDTLHKDATNLALNQTFHILKHIPYEVPDDADDTLDPINHLKAEKPITQEKGKYSHDGVVNINDFSFLVIEINYKKFMNIDSQYAKSFNTHMVNIIQRCLANNCIENLCKINKELDHGYNRIQKELDEKRDSHEALIKKHKAETKKYTAEAEKHKAETKKHQIEAEKHKKENRKLVEQHKKDRDMHNEN
jgi:hypothetical protein